MNTFHNVIIARIKAYQRMKFYIYPQQFPITKEF